MRVRNKQLVIFNATGWDIIDNRGYNPPNGTLVRVTSLPGCPPPNTMGHCYIETVPMDTSTPRFIGLVSTASLSPATDEIRKMRAYAKKMADAKAAFDKEFLNK